MAGVLGSLFVGAAWAGPVARGPVARPDRERPIVLAIVDDGFRLEHAELRELWWDHPGEIPANGRDDDGNGRVDDVRGWDVADGDGHVEPPADRRAEFAHGTHLAGVVAATLRDALGDEAARAVRLLPVKAMEDETTRPYLIPGYDGIDYAIDAGADVILCAWSVAELEASQRAILDRAVAAGVLVVGAAGNLASVQPHFPAAHPGVLSVAARGADGRRLPRSSFGGTVDLSAPGEAIEGADAEDLTGRRRETGTSPAAAQVAAAAAVVWSEHPTWTASEVRAALLSASREVRDDEERVAASMGAGVLDLTTARERSPWASRTVWTRAGGSIPLVRPGGTDTGFSLLPAGLVDHVELSLDVVRATVGALRTGRLEVHAGRGAHGEPLWAGALVDFPPVLVVPGRRAYVRFTRGRGAFEAFLRYRAEPVDVARRWCGAVVPLDAPGTLEDGSGDAPYAAASDCKWQITAPEGQVVRFVFDEVDTQPKVDQLLFFDGRTTADRMMAGVSGTDLPPAFTSWGREVLLWFVSDEHDQRTGWKLRYDFVPRD